MTPPRRRLVRLAVPAACLALAAAAYLNPVASRQDAILTLMSSSAPSSPAAACTGVTPAVIPAAGFITNPARTQGGHFWWRPSAGAGSTCVGTVIQWVEYTTLAAKTWDVIIYSAQHPAGQIAAEQTFTLPRGWYWLSVGIHQAYPGLRAVCITATDGFGEPCVNFASGSPVPAPSPAPAGGSLAAATPGSVPPSSPAVIPASQLTQWPGQAQLGAGGSVNAGDGLAGPALK